MRALLLSLFMIPLAIGCGGGDDAKPKTDTHADEDCSDDAAPAVDWLATGPHPVGWQTHEGTSQLGDTPLERLTVVYYPATETGEGQPPAIATGGYPVVFFEHAGGSHYLNYDVIFKFLAGHGLVIVSIDHTQIDSSSMGWGSADWWDGHDLLFKDTIREFKAWGETPGHTYTGLMDFDSVGLAGHSHGSALLTMQGFAPINPLAETNIRAVALLAPCPDEVMSDYLEAYAGMAPIQVIYGARDQDGCVAYGQSIAIFEAGDQPSHFIHLPGGSHYGFTDEGGLLDATITRADHQVVASAGWLAWWKYTLEDDKTALPYLRGDRALLPDGPEVHTQYTERSPLLIDQFDAPVEGGVRWEEVPAIVGLEGQTFINGFLSDTFVDEDQGVGLIQRELETLLADTSGTASVLFFVDAALGAETYAPALEALQARGEIALTLSSSHGEFASAILAGGWDIIVAATQTGSPTDEHPYDSPLADWICDGKKAIVSDYRVDSSGAASVLACSGTAFGSLYNFESIVSDGDLFGDTISLYNPGWGTFSVGLEGGTATRFAHTSVLMATTSELAPNALGHKPEYSGLDGVASEWMLNNGRGVYHPSWGLTITWSSPGGHFRQILSTDGGVDLSKLEALSFRILQRHDDPLNTGGPQDLHIRLVDTLGRSASVLLSSARQGALRPNPPVGLGTHEKSVYETYRIPFALLTDVDPGLRLDSIKWVDWIFDATPSGAITLDDIVFTRAGVCE